MIQVKGERFAKVKLDYLNQILNAKYDLSSVFKRDEPMLSLVLTEMVAEGGGTDFMSTCLPYPISGSAAGSFKYFLQIKP